MKKLVVLLSVISISFIGCGGGGSSSNHLKIDGVDTKILHSKPKINEPADIMIFNNLPEDQVKNYYKSYRSTDKRFVLDKRVECTDYSFEESELYSVNSYNTAEIKTYMKYNVGRYGMGVACAETNILVNKGKYTVIIATEH